MPRPEADNQTAELKKRLFLKTGVWLFSAIIAGLWLFSLGINFKQQALANDDKSPAVAAWQMELNQAIGAIKSSVNFSDQTFVGDEIVDNSAGEDFLVAMNNSLEKKVVSPEMEADASASELITNDKSATTTPESMLKDLEKRLPTVVNNCPDFINCMPLIDEVRPCLIPPGCENITQIVY